MERGKAVERRPEPDVAREIVGGRRASRAVRAREEGGKNDGPSPILMGVNRRAGGKEALRCGERREDQNSDSEDDD